METGLMQLGVGGIFAVLVLRQVFDFLSRKKNGWGASKIARQIDDLHRWHDVRDSEGVPIWYVRKSLDSSIERLADNIEKQTETLRLLASEVKESRRASRQQ